jgi:predicted HicB family RNase H-like nuclease
MAPPRKTTSLNVRISPTLKARAGKAAAEDHRPLSSLVSHLLDKHCRELGEAQPAPKRSGK